MRTRFVYLIHFDRPLHHARHYLGSAVSISLRVAEHRAGKGAKLLAAVNAAGIGWSVVRTWRGGRRLERVLKNKHKAGRLCPCCRNDPTKGWKTHVS